MDLIPKPDQVVSAAANVAHKLFYGGLADLRPMPRTLIDEGVLREVYHYRPRGTARSTATRCCWSPRSPRPSLCFDLRRGCSLVEHLVDGGPPTYLVEYGEVSFKNRSLGMEHWVDEVVPERDRGGQPARRRPARARRGLEPRRHLRAAHRRRPPDLPIASRDHRRRPDRRLAGAAGRADPAVPRPGRRAGRAGHAAYRLMGGVPKPLVRGPSSSRVQQAGHQADRDRWPSSTTPTSSPRSRPSTASPRT